jgi:hypothetical protein
MARIYSGALCVIRILGAAYLGIRAFFSLVFHDEVKDFHYYLMPEKPIRRCGRQEDERWGCACGALPRRRPFRSGYATASGVAGPGARDPAVVAAAHPSAGAESAGKVDGAKDRSMPKQCCPTPLFSRVRPVGISCCIGRQAAP